MMPRYCLEFGTRREESWYKNKDLPEWEAKITLKLQRGLAEEFAYSYFREFMVSMGKAFATSGTVRQHHLTRVFVRMGWEWIRSRFLPGPRGRSGPIGR